MNCLKMLFWVKVVLMKVQNSAVAIFRMVILLVICAKIEFYNLDWKKKYRKVNLERNPCALCKAYSHRLTAVDVRTLSDIQVFDT